MSIKVKVKPSRPDLKVRNPKNMLFLDPEGEVVEMGTYWDRRIQCGDVVVVEDKPAKVSKQ